MIYILFGALLILHLVLLSWIYVKDLIRIRNENEYKNVVEVHAEFLAKLLVADPNLIHCLEENSELLRFLPDGSGFLVVLDDTGKTLFHGNPDGCTLPSAEVLETAKLGGGYLRHAHHGRLFQCYVCVIPGSPFVVCSGLFMDTETVKERCDWKQKHQTLSSRALVKSSSRVLATSSASPSVSPYSSPYSPPYSTPN